MKSRLFLVLMVVAMMGTVVVAQKRQRQRLNPMINLLEQHQVIVGGVPAPYPRTPAAGGAAAAGGAGRGAGAAETAAAAPASAPAPDACGIIPAPRGEGRGGGGGGGRGAANPAAAGGAAAANRGGGEGRGGGGRGAAAGTNALPQAANMDEAARMTLAMKSADFLNGSMEGGVDNAIGPFAEFMKALSQNGALVKQPYAHLAQPYYVKTPKVSRNPAKSIDNISKQLNTGLSGVIFVAVDCAKELQMGLAAMRPKSKGGTRPDDYGAAPAYWGLSEKEYRNKADVWGLNDNGELVSWVIIESKDGLKNIREIAKVKGIGVLISGAGTLNGVLRDDPDPNAWEKAQQTILSACKEFNVNCGFPASTPEVIEMRQKQGFNVFVLQSWSQQSFDTMTHGRKLGARATENQ